MKFFEVLLVVAFVTMAQAQPVAEGNSKLESATGAQKLNMKEVEKLLQQIEAEEQNIKPQDATVSESLQTLFATFRQMTSAYVNVLNAVNKSLGLPKYPTIPGLSRVVRQDDSPSPPTPLRQIQENLSQLQTTAMEVGQLVRRVVTNMGEDGRHTVLNQFRRFTDLWAKQLGEISGMLENAIHNSPRQDQETVFDQINRYIQQVSNNIRDFANNIVNNVRNRIMPTTFSSLSN